MADKAFDEVEAVARLQRVNQLLVATVYGDDAYECLDGERRSLEKALKAAADAHRRKKADAGL